MASANVTVSLPSELIKEARHIAVERGLSLSALVADIIRNLVTTEDEHEASMKRLMKILDKGFHLGTNGHISWTREELHERR
jgi:hypothetical protein